ncbi:MAG: vWA domain-containing protein [Polyangiales bacterium]
MLRTALSRLGVVAVAAALGCAGDGRPTSLSDEAIDASFADVPSATVRGVGGGSVGGGGGSGRTPSGDAASPGCGSTAVLVVDRSGSMRDSTLDGAQKWSALLSALESVLPRIEDRVSLGLVLFPQPGTADGCGLRATLDLEPQLHAASTILARLRATPPDGPTPTASAIEVAGGWFASHPDAEGERYVILATDGAPNCNAALSPSTCTCAGPATSCRPGASSTQCLDDLRTVATIGDLRRRSVSTYVIGLNGAEAFSNVLDAMADAGGRARAATPRFYPANTASDLAREFSAVTSVIASNCP